MVEMELFERQAFDGHDTLHAVSSIFYDIFLSDNDLILAGRPVLNPIKKR
jgi:hypothetical protein